MSGRRILLIIGGGVAAYKSLELIRRLQDRDIAVTAVLTPAATAFVTPLSVGALTGSPVHTELLSLTAETEMGHIELSRSADLIVVAPATADLMSKMASGAADDLASTILLATDTPVLAAPSMNVRMWEHPATQRNMATLRGDGVALVGPAVGAMACGEYGPGRLAEVEDLAAAAEARLTEIAGAATEAPTDLTGLSALITSGPTHEPIDPVRFLGNRSSGRQGVAIAEALARRGAAVDFVTGPAEAATPSGCRSLRRVETAAQMRSAVLDLLKAAPDIAIFAAAVADWRVAEAAGGKIKKGSEAQPPSLRLVENPDILREVAALEPPRRPSLVVGFAAETDAVLENARSKRRRKGCDWLVANDVSAQSGVMGGLDNEAVLITDDGEETWPRTRKTEIAARLAERIGRWAAAQ